MVVSIKITTQLDSSLDNLLWELLLGNQEAKSGPRKKQKEAPHLWYFCHRRGAFLKYLLSFNLLISTIFLPYLINIKELLIKFDTYDYELWSWIYKLMPKIPIIFFFLLLLPHFVKAQGQDESIDYHRKNWYTYHSDTPDSSLLQSAIYLMKKYSTLNKDSLLAVS